MNLPIIEVEKTKIQKNDSVRVEVTLTQEQFEKLGRCRELLSNSSLGGTWADVIDKLSEAYLEKNDPVQIEERGRKSGVTATAAVKVRKAISAPLRRKIMIRDQTCQYRNSHTGRICGNKNHLQLDHVHPVWAGGEDSEENLRVLCANHNRQRYREQAGLS